MGFLDHHRIFLGLGANQGDRLTALHKAAAELSPAVTVLRASLVYETEPWGYVVQPKFLNQVIEAETSLDPMQLLAYLKGIEQHMGRLPTFRYGPRVIDLDILLYEDQVIDNPFLQVPHPHLPERAFVLAPLAELSPDLLHPQLHKSMAQLLGEIDAGGVTPYGV